MGAVKTLPQGIPLGELADISMGCSFRARLEHDPSGKFAVVQMKDLSDRNEVRLEGAIRLQLEANKAHHLLQIGDLLFRSRGCSHAAALVKGDMEAAILAAPMLLIRPHSVLPAYLFWCINSPPVQKRLKALAEGTSVKMISAEALKALEIPFPSQVTQMRIGEAAALAEREVVLLARAADLRRNLTNQLLMKVASEASQ